MTPRDMEATALELVAPGKGILAADESHPTIEKRFKAVGVAATEENRRAYRELLFSTPGLGAFISGVILFDETLRQKSADGRPLASVLAAQGIIPGIKVDRGAKPLAGFPGEKITDGLDGLRERLHEYSELGVRFAKWRAVIPIGTETPSSTGIAANAHALARYAALCQEAGLVPIVEPEVLMDGPHDIQRHAGVTSSVIRTVFQALAEHRVRLEAMLLKPNMVLSGTECPTQASIADVAKTTRETMMRVVPAAVPGLVFLSGGQSDLQATEHLNTLNQLDRTPWELSFSFGRALQSMVLKTWAGHPSNLTAAQQTLHHRAACNSAARLGTYTQNMEQAA